MSTKKKGGVSPDFNDWLEQSARDLQAAETLEKAKLYEHAVFYAHQSAEKLAKSLFVALSFPFATSAAGGGHSLTDLFAPWAPHLKDDADLDVAQQALLELDTRMAQPNVMSPRYPTATHRPKDAFDQKQAQTAIEAAKKLFDFGAKKVPEIVAKLKPPPKPAAPAGGTPPPPSAPPATKPVP